MKLPQKRTQILLAVALLLYACGYLTQFIGNYAAWRKNGGMLGGTSPPFPSLSPLACIKGILWFPYNLYCVAGCAAAVAAIFLYRKLFSQDALTDSERNFDFSAKGTYGTSGWMQREKSPPCWIQFLICLSTQALCWECSMASFSASRRKHA